MGASTSKPKAEDDVDAIPTPAIKPPSVEYLERYKTTIYRQRSGLEGLGPIVQLMRVRNVPSSEAGFEPTTQVRMFLRTRSVQFGRASTWPVRYSTRDPVWNSARRLNLPESPGELFLHIELVEQNALGATSHLGVGEISLAMLSEAEYTTVPITIMRAKAARTSAHVRLAREPAALKTVYFVRHGESVWNRAQARADVITLVSDTDHPLNDAGKQQAEALQRKLARLVELAHRDQSALEAWEADAQRRAEEIVAAGKVKQGEPGAVRAAAKAAAHAAAAEGARAERGESPRRRGRVAPGGAGAPPPPPSLLSDVERGLVDVQSIASSPLTRAIQTTAIGLAPLLRRSGARLRLMANLREKKNLGGFDSAGAAKGKAVRGRLRETTTPLFKGAEAALSEHVLKGTPLDTTEVEGKWWHDSPESKAEVRTRIDELLCQLQFASEERIALVGHSHFFREVFRHHLHPRYRARNRIMSMRLSGQKLENCGIVAVTFDFAERDRLYAELGEDGMRNRPEAAGVIVDVKLMLGTRLVGSESKLKL